VQLGHLTALIDMVEKQYGHSFVEGAAGAGAGASLFNLFIFFIKIKIEKATIRKLTTVFKNAP
jgi:hypothetical protein